jgi:SAM-dependent methyltransferase
MSVPPVLDPASGSRMFYFDREDDRVHFGDIRSESHVLCDGRALEVNPDVVMDFRQLPHPDDTFSVVIFDPPHLVRVGAKSWMFKKYGGLNVTTWREDLAAGFAECFRVLSPAGVLIFKWNETQIPVSQILALTPHRPLVGHKIRGKSADTHWFTFLKDGAP